MNVLLVTSSPRGTASISTRVAGELAHSLVREDPYATLVHRDLNQSPVPFISEEFVRAMHVPAESRTEEEARALRLSDVLIAELQRADQIVIGSGMINFSIPAPLKAWIDHVTRAGLTFSYGAHGPEGLLKGKKSYLVLASGGVYSEGPGTALDFQRPYLISVLRFLGLTDMEMVTAEGTMLGPEAGERALGVAREHVARIGNRNTPLVAANH